MSRILTGAVLAGSGTILGLVGSALMFAPQAFLELSDVVVARDPGLMSELTAPSGVLLITGGLMILAVFKPRFAKLALGVGAFVYGSYSVSRLIGMVVHGVPSSSLIAATWIELGIAALLITLRWRHVHDV